MRCATCGTENAPDSRFCGGCGAKQPGKTAPTAKILDDASYPATGQPQSGPASIPPSSYGHGPASIPPPAMPTPAPGSIVQPGSFPPSIAPTNDPGRHISRPPDVSRHVSVPPSQQRPNVSAPDVSRAQALSGDSIALPPRRPIALIAIVLVIDLGLAAAGAVMLGKGLSSDKPAAKPDDKAPQKTEALPAPDPAPPPPAEAPAAAASAPSVPSAAAIASVTAPADPAPAIAADAKTANAAADKSSASRRAKDKERSATPTETTKTDSTKTDSTKSDPTGPVTLPSSTSPQDPYVETAPAPKLTTEQEVNKLVASSQSAFDRCAGAAQAQGKIQVAFQVLADGRVANAAAVENSTGSAELGQCLVATIKGWTLSPHSGSALSFVRPFNYP